VSNEQTSFAEAFKKADNVLFDGVKGLTDLITQPGLINLDFADVRTVIKEMGFAMMGTSVAEGDNKAVEASNLALTNPLIENIDMNTAKGVIVNISGGSDMTLLEVDHAANIIRQSVNPEANIIFGSLIDETLQGKLKISIFATGIEASGKKILYYPESENNSGFSSIQNKIDESLSYGGSNNRSYEDISRIVENESVNSENEEFNQTDEQDKITEDNQEIIDKNIENKNINHENLEEEKKPGFFRMLSNLITSDKKTNEVSKNIPEKRKKSKKTKTDPNLFLFGEVVEDEVDKAKQSLNSDEISEVSNISEFSDENETNEDIDTPSYLRKGSNQ
tara:strand:- start:432 stop:1436 length:1005 start_codon:yes stop_codon:yes gene_type:complete